MLQFNPCSFHSRIHFTCLSVSTARAASRSIRHIPPSLQRKLTSTAPTMEKLTGFDFYRSIGSPRYVLAPMVDASELAWRVLARLHGAQLCFTPMFHAAQFATSLKYRLEQFDFDSAEEGDAMLDRPLIAQFCAHDPEQLHLAAKLVADSGKVDAVDLNLGCPQGIAKRGHYGAFLMEDWPLIGNLISKLDQELSVPVTAKFRAYPTSERTLEYAKFLESSGAQMLSFHSRTRDQKGQATGLADWSKTKAVKATTGVPVFGNGNILRSLDIKQCLQDTSVDGVMSAEGHLYNPQLFRPQNAVEGDAYRSRLPALFQDALAEVDKQFPPDATNSEEWPLCAKSAMQYLVICSHLRTRTAMSAVRGHLHKLWLPIFEAGHHLDIRDGLGKVREEEDAGNDNTKRMSGFWKLANDMRQRLLDEAATEQGIGSSLTLADGQIPAPLPYWRCQPHLRTFAVVDNSSSDPSEQVDNGAVLESRLYAAVSCVRKGCLNNSSAKCVVSACKSCCASLLDSETRCEAHEARARAEKDKKALQKERREANETRKRQAQESREREAMAKRRLKKPRLDVAATITDQLDTIPHLP